MGIPIGQTITAQVSGSCIKHVCCANCQTDFVYVAQRTGGGQGSSLLFLDNEGAKERAEGHAVKNLETELEKAVDPVPCPNCFRYQDDMVEELKKKYLGWTENIDLVLFVVFIVAAIALAIQWSSFVPKAWIIALSAIGIVLSLGGVLGLIYYRKIHRQEYDPNEDSIQTRSAISRDRAMLKEEFEKLMKEKSAAE